MTRLLALVPLMALVLSGCLPSLPAAGPVTLRLLVPQLRDAPIDTTAERYKAIADQLNDARLGFKLELTRLPTTAAEYADAVASENANPDRAPDLIVAHHGDVPGLADRQAIVSLDRYAKDDRELHLDDYFPAVLAANRYHGQLYAIPYICSPQVVYYNPRMFAAANLKPPSSTWTWQDFVQIARALTRDSDRDGKIDQFGFIQAPGVPSVATYIWQNGGDIVDASGRVVLDQPAAVEAIKFMGDLTLAERITPTMSDLSQRSAEELLLKDRVGMVTFHVSIGMFWRGEAGLNFELAEPPQGKARATLLTSSALAVGAKTRNPEVAYRALRAIVAEAEKGALVPPRRSLARDLRKIEPRLSDQDVRVIANALEYARGPVYDNHQAVMTALRNYVELPVLTGQSSAQDAAKAGATAIHQLLQPKKQ